MTVRSSTIRGLAFAVVLAGGAVALSGCGFTPLYATPGVTPGLSSIGVELPKGRAAHLLGESLEDAFATDRSAPPAYKLGLVLEERRLPRGLRIDNVANRYELSLTTTYSLVDAARRVELTKGSVQVSVTYDSSDAPYAGIAAQNDAQKRAANETAQRLRIELADWFAKHPQG